MRVLFLSYANGHAGYNPYAVMIHFPMKVDIKRMHKIESNQIGVNRRGGSWKEILEGGKYDYHILSEGRFSDYSPHEYDEVYHLITGNY